MKPPLLAALAAFALGSSVAPAQTFVFDPFEFDSPDQSLLDPITIDLTVSEDFGGIIFEISNRTIPGDDWATASIPTVTNIYFEDSGGLLTAPNFVGGSGGSVSYSDATDGGAIAGGSGIDFVSAFYFQAEPPPTTNGIDPGESGTFGATAPSLAEVIDALNTGEIRVGLRVQQIGEKDQLSASYVSRVPEPSTAILSLAALAGFFFIRRRR